MILFVFLTKSSRRCLHSKALHGKFSENSKVHDVCLMAKESAMVQIESNVTCVCDSSRWMDIVGFQLRLFCGCNLCNLPVLPVPREGQIGRRPPADFEQPEWFGDAPPSEGAAGGGRASLPRGSKEVPVSPASRISKVLWAMDPESHLSWHWTFVG